MSTQRTKLVCEVSQALFARGRDALLERIGTLEPGAIGVWADDAAARQLRDLDLPVPVVLALRGRGSVWVSQDQALRTIDPGDRITAGFEGGTDLLLSQHPGRALSLDAVLGAKLDIGPGKAEFQVEAVNGGCLTLVSLRRGIVTAGQSVVTPAWHGGLFPLGAEDKALLSSLGEAGGYVSVPNLRSVAQLDELRELVFGSQEGTRRHPSVSGSGPGARVPPRLLIRVDSREALDLLPALLVASDGVVLSRQELAAQVDLADLPLIQKNVIAQCNQLGKVCILAGELLTSMAVNPTPTRAEVSDLANACADGADALWIGVEVSCGPYPQEVFSLAREALAHTPSPVNWDRVPFALENDDDAVAWGALRAARRSRAKAIVCVTEGGYTAGRLASLRPPVPILALTRSPGVARQLALLSSVVPRVTLEKVPLDRMLEVCVEAAKQDLGLVRGTPVCSCPLQRPV